MRKPECRTREFEDVCPCQFVIYVLGTTDKVNVSFKAILADSRIKNTVIGSCLPRGVLIKCWQKINVAQLQVLLQRGVVGQREIL